MASHDVSRPLLSSLVTYSARSLFSSFIGSSPRSFLSRYGVNGVSDGREEE